MARKREILSQDQVRQKIIEGQVPESRKSDNQTVDDSVSKYASKACKKAAASSPIAEESRETDRLLNRLERLQRMRKGQPLLPQVDVKIS